MMDKLQSLRPLIIMLASFLAGSIAVLAMPPFGIWPCIIAAFAALYILYIKADSPKTAALIGWCFGFGYFLFGLYWIGNALLVEGNNYRWAWPLAVAGLPVLLSLFPAIALFLSKKIFNGKPFFLLLAFTATFSAFEWLRGHAFTGFPWNLPAYAWADMLPIAQIASLGGSYFLSLLTIFWGASIGFVIIPVATMRMRLIVAGLAILTFAGTYAYGYIRLANAEKEPDSNLLVQIVQPSIPQHEKWQADKVWGHFNTLVNFSYSSNVSEGKPLTLIVWPETAFALRLLDNPVARDYLRAALQSHPGETYLLSGVLRSRKTSEGTEHFNSFVVLDKDLNIINIYDKNHLVPFGEYIPLQQFLPLNPVANFTGMTAGTNREAAILGKYAITPLICYEVIFPHEIQPDGARGNSSRLIVNVTNDAWYGLGSGPYQHFQMAVFRAIEQGKPVIRAANNGISGIIDPYGRVIARMPLNQRGSLIRNPFPLYRLNTPVYCKLQDSLFWFAIVIFWAITLFRQHQGYQKLGY